MGSVRCDACDMKCGKLGAEANYVKLQIEEGGDIFCYVFMNFNPNC